MNQSTDATSDELLDAALDILVGQDREPRKAARRGLEQIVESVKADWGRPNKSSRATTAKQLNELARAATTASRRLAEGNPTWRYYAACAEELSLERGAPVALVRDTLEHSSVSTTNGYLHARPNDSSARYLAV